MIRIQDTINFPNYLTADVLPTVYNFKIFRKMDSDPLERCDNCLKEFPESKIATHFGYCRRNIKKCPVCQEMFDINFKEDHEEEFHRKDKCPHCSKEFSQADFKEHQKKCEHKPRFCQYCELNVPVATYATHFAACESRTKPCTKCNKPIMNKDYIIHTISCEGIVSVEPKKPSNYQQYLNQYQKKGEEVYFKNQVDRVASREKPNIKPKEQNKYAEITNRREDVRVYEPKIINPPRPQFNKKEYINYPPQSKPQVKREEVPTQKRFTGSINAVNVPKKQDSKSIGIKPTALSTQQAKRASGSREAVRPAVSNKDIFPQSIKDSKSSEKNGFMKRQEDPRQKYGVPSYKGEQIKRPTVDRQIIDNKNRNPPVVPRPKEEITRKKSPQTKNEYIDHHELGEFGLSPEEQMMQEILMQSANEHRGSKNRMVPPPASKPSSKNEVKEIPYIQGEDFMNESFIAKQRAIEEELQRKKRGKR